MKQKRSKDARAKGGTTIHFTLVGLVVFSVLLVAVGGLVAYGLTMYRSKDDGRKVPNNFSDYADANRPAPTNMPPWGELIARDVELEQPEEYVAFELQTNRVGTWVFKGMTADKVRALMLSCGVASKEVDHALSPQLARTTASGVVIQPDDELILSLSPQVRGKLYGKLANDDANHYMKYPFCYPGKSFENCLGAEGVSKEDWDLIKKLLYPRGNAQCFSDYEWLLRHVITEEKRLALVKALSRQTAVLLRLHIRPDTDVDRLLGYWGSVPGVRLKDMRPLLESVKRMEEGGSVSVLYLLPPFVRQRLYTFPLPGKAGDPAMDCHWSTMNFFNETPDDRFSDATFTAKYVTDNFYQVAKPSFYGDIIFILDAQGNAIHSGVYICDDVIFTKNGNNFAQPWMLMRLKDLLARYDNADAPTRLVAYRNKDR